MKLSQLNRFIPDILLGINEDPNIWVLLFLLLVCVLIVISMYWKQRCKDVKVVVKGDGELPSSLLPSEESSAFGAEVVYNPDESAVHDVSTSSNLAEKFMESSGNGYDSDDNYQGGDDDGYNHEKNQSYLMF
jgi:hypothetical protein